MRTKTRTRAIRDAAAAFAAYEAARHRLPAFPAFPALPAALARGGTGRDGPERGGPERGENLGDIAERYDAFLLDAFGVLNLGQTPIPGATAAVAALQRAGKRVLALTNGATHTRAAAVANFRRMGFDFAAEDVVSSRDALRAALALRPTRDPASAPAPWGVMAPARARIDELGPPAALLGDDPAIYAAARGFLLLGSSDWSAARQTRLRDALRARPRPLLVGNPDIVAPRETGFTLAPGHFAHALADELGAETGLTPEFFGKPFGNAFDLARARLGRDAGRVVMVGDTLHTDILGGAAAGFDTALIAGHGLFAGCDPEPFIARSGIVPTYLLQTV